MKMSGDFSGDTRLGCMRRREFRSVLRNNSSQDGTERIPGVFDWTWNKYGRTAMTNARRSRSLANFVANRFFFSPVEKKEREREADFVGVRG